VLLLVHHPWREEAYLDFALDSLGYVLVVFGVLVRLWATLYVGGRKETTLQTTGPYSVVRHPLYLGSLTIGLGVSALSENPLVLALFVAYFLVQYSTTIRHEEEVLKQAFGDEYAEYARRVPCFVPRISTFDATPPDRIVVWALRKELVRSVCFLAAIPILDLIARLHESGTLWSLRFP
jgi:protein-S-isoprenylcysteine O-methyltransferase Ste14